MAYLSAVVGVQDSSGTRVDSPDALGDYLPIVLKIGANITPTAAQVGGVSVVTLTGAAGVTSVTGTSPIASSGGATPAISIAAASALGSGSMSVAHWTLLDGATDAATASTLVKRDASSVTKLSALATGATPATTGQVRLTDSTIAIRASIVGISGQNDRTVIGTIGEGVTLGSGFGSAYAQILDGGTEGFYVSDPTIVGPSGTYLSVTSAAAALTVPLAMGSNKITGLADGVAASDAATVGQLGGGATIVAPSASALLWVLNETFIPFAQTGKAVSLDMTLTGAGELSFAAPLGDGVWLPSGAVTLRTADTTEGEATDWTWHWWGYGAAASADYVGLSKIAVTGSAFAIALQVDAGGADAVLVHRHAGSTASTTITCPRLKKAMMGGAWHHVALSFDGSVSKRFRIYLDGTLVWTSSAEAAVVDWGDHRGYYVTGTHGIQRITVEPTTLTLAAIREIATRGLGWVQ